METGLGLFVYNRPEHTRRVLDGLRENDPEHLYVFSDGPKSDADAQRVNEVRAIIDDIDWCETELVAHEENVGLVENNVTGVEYMFEENDRIIALEDDDVPSSDFLSFTNDCLDEYQDSSAVMSISGFSLPIPIPDDYPYDVYFTYRAGSWGWATWKDDWEHFEQDPMPLSELREREDEIRRIAGKAGGLYELMEHQLRGETESWSTWWAWAVLKNNGFTVNPVTPRVRNIGHDGSGTHSGNTNKFDIEIQSGSGDISFPEYTVVDPVLNERHNNYADGTFVDRVKQRVRKRVGSL
jgi:hypothetical protein